MKWISLMLSISLVGMAVLGLLEAWAAGMTLLAVVMGVVLVLLVGGVCASIVWALFDPDEVRRKK